MQVSIIQNKIYEIQGQKVMIDRDLASLYDVETRTLNQSVQRNLSRFPQDFMFQLNKAELESLISQNVISKKSGRGGTRKMPYAFTEQGVAMLSSILNSEKAIHVNIVIIRTFVLLRNAALNYAELSDKIKKLEKKYTNNFREVFKALEYLIVEKQNEKEFSKRERIGFKP